MKKLLVLLISIMIVLSCVTVQAEGHWENIYVEINDINIKINDEYVFARNLVHEGTTYLALRDMGTALGYNVGWNEETKTASLDKADGKLEYNFDKQEKSTDTIPVLVNDISVLVDGQKIDARNFLYNDSTYLALRDIGNATGYEVSWDEETKTAILTKKDTSTPSHPFYATVNSIEIPGVYLIQCYNSAITKIPPDQIGLYLDNQAKYYAYIVSECAKNNLSLTDEELKLVEDYFETSIEAQGGKEAVKSTMADAGYPFEKFKKECIEMLCTDLLAQKLTAYMADNNDIIKSIYAEAVENYEADKDELIIPIVRVKHILIPISDALPKEDAKAKADEIHKKLESGESFEEHLKQNDNDPGQTDDGYEVYNGSNFVKSFEEASLKLKKDEISPVVESTYGYHIIKAYDTYINQISFDEYLQIMYGEAINQAYDNEFINWCENAEITAGWNE